MRPCIRYFDTGPLPVHFGVSFEQAAFAKEMKRLGVDQPPQFVTPGAAASVHTLESTSGAETTVILCLDPQKARGRTPVEIAGLCAHEATHCMQSTIEAMRDSEPSRELQAYLVQWFTQVALIELGRFRKAKR